MSFISAFDVMGPNMIGPSSSHTAGAARISYLAQKMIEGPLKRADFILYGSFAVGMQQVWICVCIFGGMRSKVIILS